MMAIVCGSPSISATSSGHFVFISCEPLLCFIVVGWDGGRRIV